MSNYRLLHNTAYINYHGDKEVEIGKIVDSSTDEVLMYIHYKKDIFKETGLHTCAFIYENENGEYLVAIVDDIHRECLYNQPTVFIVIALHEYGHYINGDLNAEHLTTQMVLEERLRCIKEGRVIERELKADAFAIAHVGKNAFMRYIDYLIKKRRERGDDGMHLAIQEFELRKKAARKL